MKGFMAGVICLVLGLSAVLLSACSSKAAAPALSQDELDGRARSFVSLMSGGKPADAVKMMEPKMATALPEAKVTELWSGLTTQLGTFQAISKTRYAEANGYRMVYVTCAFSVAEIEAKVVFDSTGKVTGLWFGTPQRSTQPGTTAYTTPTYVDTASFTEQEVFVGDGDRKLPATLTLPNGNGPFPAVVLVHGSGANDRDETIGPTKPFKDLAWGLASKGIAVLRYEKRTMQYPSELAAREDITVQDETINDAVDAVRLLRGSAKVDPDKVYVVGHSLGAMLAPRIAGQVAAAGKPLRGAVLLAANARNLLDIIAEQVDYLASLDGKVDDAEAKQVETVKGQIATIRAGGLKTGESSLGAFQAYWSDLIKYDQVATAKSLDIPMLLLQGERDYQVTMADFNLWKEALSARPDVTLKSYPDLNHMFIPGQGKSTPSEYDKPGSVSPEVVDDVAAWIKSR